MSIKTSVAVLALAALAALAGCGRGTAPSEPAAGLALSDGDGTLAAEIRADIRCLYDGRAENRTLRRFGNAENKKEQGRIGQLQNLVAGLIADVQEDFEQDRLHRCNGTAVHDVVARLIAALSDFGELPPVDAHQLGGVLEEGGSITIFRLERGGGDVLPDGCIGFFVPAQSSNRGWVTILLEEPAGDPGFGSFPGVDTAPFWVVMTSTFEGPFSPQVRIGWFLIDNQGEFPKDPSAEPPPPDANVENCTIRNEQLVCGADLEETSGELGGDLALQCQTGEEPPPNFFQAAAWKALQPLSPLFDVDPLFANPGNTGLRSSFTSPFGSVFEEEGGEEPEPDTTPTTTTLSPSSATASDFQTQTYTATVAPDPGSGTVDFSVNGGSAVSKPVGTGGTATLDVECRPDESANGADVNVTYGQHTIDATFTGTGTHDPSTANQATFDCEPPAAE